MTSQIVCAYTATATGIATPAALNGSMANVALDKDLLQLYGLRVLTDATATSGTAVTRTITLGMNPSVAAAATAFLVPGDGPNSPIDHLTVGVAGADYVNPPVVAPAVQAGVTRPALLHATLGVSSTTVLVGGGVPAYSAATIATFSGGQLAPGGKQAVGNVTLAVGVVVAVNVTDPGGPYTIAPIVTISDTGGGGGAVVAVHLGVTAVVIDDPGVGYKTPPAISFTPTFKAMFPDGTDQVSPMTRWMQQVFRQALRQPVLSVTPVVS